MLDVVRAQWDTEQRAFRLPRGLRMLLADVDAGTDTPSFVGKVLQWRKDKPEEGALERCWRRLTEPANALWDDVDARNRELEACFAALVEHESDADYDAVLAAAAAKSIADVRPPSLPFPTDAH